MPPRILRGFPPKTLISAASPRHAPGGRRKESTRLAQGPRATSGAICASTSSSARRGSVARMLCRRATARGPSLARAWRSARSAYPESAAKFTSDSRWRRGQRSGVDDAGVSSLKIGSSLVLRASRFAGGFLCSVSSSSVGTSCRASSPHLSPHFYALLALALAQLALAAKGFGLTLPFTTPPRAWLAELAHSPSHLRPWP
ncbi:hypothetical protein B0H15DRAFT_993488 [Mycena belliarum]|uniref:Ig-like domain-containing protein n=1 Tax=Mycena belliarum TaxID=1033014 RepID=A0AAD6U2L2_9AGAR|nr:hypothetical protein B0H15DRAFT_993488 [Mycena belliae]